MTLIATQFEPNSPGIQAFLKGPEVTQMINDLANGVRTRVGEDAVTEKYVTDRAAAAVVWKDPKAAGKEGRDGTLAKAVGSAGLEIKGGQ